MPLDLAAIQAAHARIRPHIHRTPVLTSASPDAGCGGELLFKCENFQKPGMSEESIIAAMRQLWETLKIVVEPCGAVPYAALLEGKLSVSAQRVGLILTGGNVDLDALPWVKGRAGASTRLSDPTASGRSQTLPYSGRPPCLPPAAFRRPRPPGQPARSASGVS